MKQILNHALISERYFFPRFSRFEPTTWVQSGEVRLSCFRSTQERPLCLLHFHGNGETISDYLPSYENLMASLNVDLFMAEYRGYGESSGTPEMGAMLDDVERILDSVERPDEEVVVFGRSVGSIYAIELASRRPKIAGLVLESGIADPQQRIRLRVSPEELGVSDEALSRVCSDYLDHEKKLKSYTNPLLILHAEKDHLVGIEHAERNFDWASSDKKALVRLPYGDHNSIFYENRDVYLSQLKGFLDGLS